ncbi:MAG: hypothetical protein K1X92_01200 [Bacteroidia bacterium]|nr:hypothetical protein [Bacteroidia bacterium]
MKKYLILWIMACSCWITAYGQLIMREMNADGEIVYPVTTISRAEYLSLSPDMQGHPERFIISDLVNGKEIKNAEDGKIYIRLSQYQSFSGERKRQVLLHPEQYIVIEDLAAQPLKEITEQELSRLSPEKQAIIRNSAEYKIIKE